LPKFHLILLIHAHQPVGNFDHVVEQAFARCYAPFVDVLWRRPAARLALHISGALLEWVEQHHPEYFDRLRELIQRNQIEMVGGGFYEPILVAIPPEDRAEQLARMADYLERHFGCRPTGAWLTERVWEPHLPATLAAAGVQYTLVDDSHFLASGFSREELYGYFLCEELGAKVYVFAGLQPLRYTIPFRDVPETIALLRAAAERRPGGCAVMGDDCEKFGVWPGTYEHCYTHGWLERFFQALEAERDWLAMVTPGEFLASQPPLGRAALPTGSYVEMTEWALPTPARQVFHRLQRQLEAVPEARAFLRGGFWRNFLTKYDEANLLHKKMLYVSGRVRQMAASGNAPAEKLESARKHLLRGQCNDAYWHGVFGGLYAPHLRTALWRELIRAETLADAAAPAHPHSTVLQRFDFDADGEEELYWVSERGALLVKPSDGGTVPLLEFRPTAVPLVNSLQRRPEAYHSRLAEASPAAAAAAVSIHEQVRVKEAGLEQHLRYDRWARHSFRLLVFAPEKSFADYAVLRLEEDAALAGGRFALLRADREAIVLAQRNSTIRDAAAELEAEKTFVFERAGGGFRVGCKTSLRLRRGSPRYLRVGVELVVNLLAPDAADRYFESRGTRHPLRWSGVLPAPELRAVDEWQNVAVTVRAETAEQFWVAPIETVSESEEGFERIYQGSQILAVWPLELNPGATWTAQLTLGVDRAR
jgi:alpha-amylase